MGLRLKVDEVLDAVGVNPSTIVQECFRMGHSHNPSYVPIIKVRLENREVVQKAIKQSGRLSRAGFHKVFIRESRPQWARDLEYNIRTMSKVYEGGGGGKRGYILKFLKKIALNFFS